MYLNELDQYVKQSLKVRYYARYTDDFVIIGPSRQYLADIQRRVEDFLHNNLLLELHAHKITVRTPRQGIDFLGYIILPHYRLLRKKTKRRIIRKLKGRVGQYRGGLISAETLNQSLQSYRGVLSHANTYQLRAELDNQYWFWLTE